MVGEEATAVQGMAGERIQNYVVHEGPMVRGFCEVFFPIFVFEFPIPYSIRFWEDSMKYRRYARVIGAGLWVVVKMGHRVSFWSRWYIRISFFHIRSVTFENIYMQSDTMKNVMQETPGQKEEYYTVEEVAEMLKVKPRSVRSWIKGKRLVSYRVADNTIRIRKSDLEMYLELCRS